MTFWEKAEVQGQKIGQWLPAGERVQGAGRDNYKGAYGNFWGARIISY